MNLSNIFKNGSKQKNSIMPSYLNRLNGLVLLFFIALMIPTLSWSKEALPVAEDLEVEKRMVALTEDLRCLVCQNESIADSRADFSNDIRREIRQQIKANKSDKEIIDFMVERYGDFVLYNPPIKTTTMLLWFGPLFLFVIGVGTLIFYLRRRRIQIEEVSLSEAQRKQAEALLNENKGNKV
ncbi:cytochrome c-type biogenesis protein CcmH [Nitrosomonas cryotolerans]|uniref:Cytochrome c-type biogenesis protein n=2 Tax=Nitrosomonas cryotolerans TaxID=44575 RepID=A0A1N6HXZ8_9PROT|nr:cytochrome c-type biogenesis protein CcmH [Nitrosomonas cryotolerans]SIO24718.1 cytochrome c-type biogenesis protein CcmH [Nitrosomonas cryotolerans ATCC 49181]